MIKQMFQGRIGVGGYWGAILTLVLWMFMITLFVIACLGIFGTHLFSGSIGGIVGYLALLSGLSLIAFFVAVFFSTGLQVRRLHDLGLSGWIVLAWWIVGLLPGVFGTAANPAMPGMAIDKPWAIPIEIVSLIFWFIVSFWPSNGEPNTYGPWIRYRSWRAGLIGSKGGATGWGSNNPPPTAPPSAPSPFPAPAVTHAPGVNLGIFPERYSPPASPPLSAPPAPPVSEPPPQAPPQTP